MLVCIVGIIASPHSRERERHFPPSTGVCGNHAMNMTWFANVQRLVT